MLFLKAQQTACALDCLRADRIAFKKERPITANGELIWRTLYFTFQNKKSGACWPSLQTIADVAGCSRRTVCTAIKQLRKAGWLRWYRQRKRFVGWRWVQAPNKYELTIPRRWRRTVAECKPCSRTTRIFIHIAAGQLMRPKKGVPQPVKIETPPLPAGYGHNRYPADMDPQLIASLESLGKAIQDKADREAERASNLP